MNENLSITKNDGIILITYLLAGIGLVIGFLALWIGYFTSSRVIPDPITDPLPDFTGFFRFIGLSFTGVALFSILGNILFWKKKIIGRLMLILVYLTGTLVSGYILLVALTRFFPLAIGSSMLPIYILLFLIGIFISYNLILNKNISA